jgi:hypothetical protein
MPSPTNACVKCQNGKRRCDRNWPSCSACHRQGKVCRYLEDDSAYNSAGETFQRQHIHPARTASRRKPKSTLRNPHQLQSSSTTSAFSLIVGFRTQAMAVLDAQEKTVPFIMKDFFDSTWQRLPVLSKRRVQSSLSFTLSESRVEFLALCLCIHLIQQLPAASSTDMITPLYLQVKNLIGLLETAGELSIDLLHCRLLIAYYEFGHGIYTAAYLSIALCGRIARAIGLQKKLWQHTDRSDNSVLGSMEEEKRLWWAIVNLERFLGLSTGDAIFVTPDSASSDYLPILDSEWEGTMPSVVDSENSIAAPILATATTITVGQMARESQVSHLAGRVVRHVYETTEDPFLYAEEASQLERTLQSFLPMLAEEELNDGKYCGALGICHRYVFSSFLLTW